MRKVLKPFDHLSVNSNMKYQLPEEDIDRIIEMAWEDRTPFDAIKLQFGLKEQEVIELMRRELKPQSWRRWRKRVQGRKTKHKAKSLEDMDRFRSRMQKQITLNKPSKPKK